MRKHVSRLFTILAMAFFFNGQANGAMPGQDETGFYVFMNHIGLDHFYPTYTTALNKSYVDGAAIVVDWSAVEPRPGVYDWTIFDRWVETTVALNKKLAIGLVAGRATPDWLYGSGYNVPKNSFSFNRNRRGVACTILTLPSPWNVTYLREYAKTMAALSKHLHELEVPGHQPGAAYAALRIVKLSGINTTTEELHLDSTPPDDGPCHQSDAAAIWAAAAFTPKKIVDAWLTIAADTNAVQDPDKILSVAVIHKNAFPSIGEDGRPMTPIRVAPDELTAEILQAGIAHYGSRLLVQWNALYGGKVAEEVVEAGRERGTHWLANEWHFGRL